MADDTTRAVRYVNSNNPTNLYPQNIASGGFNRAYVPTYNPYNPVPQTSGTVFPAIPTSNQSFSDIVSRETSAMQTAGPGHSQSPLASLVPFAASEKIKLVEEGSANRLYVILDVQPEMSESKSVQYIEISEIRSAASMLIFIGSPSRTFTINAKLVSRNRQEASENFRRLHAMKSWSQPDLTNTGNAKDLQSPRIIRIYAYGKNIKGIPTVMKSINVDYSIDCDYITTLDDSAQMPIILPVSMTFQETRTSEELERFDILKYKTGLLNEW